MVQQGYEVAVACERVANYHMDAKLREVFKSIHIAAQWMDRNFDVILNAEEKAA